MENSADTFLELDSIKNVLENINKVVAYVVARAEALDCVEQFAFSVKLVTSELSRSHQRIDSIVQQNERKSKIHADTAPRASHSVDASVTEYLYSIREHVKLCCEHVLESFKEHARNLLLTNIASTKSDSLTMTELQRVSCDNGGLDVLAGGNTLNADAQSFRKIVQGWLDIEKIIHSDAVLSTDSSAVLVWIDLLDSLRAMENALSQIKSSLAEEYHQTTVHQSPERLDNETKCVVDARAADDALPAVIQPHEDMDSPAEEQRYTDVKEFRYDNPWKDLGSDDVSVEADVVKLDSFKEPTVSSLSGETVAISESGLPGHHRDATYRRPERSGVRCASEMAIEALMAMKKNDLRGGGKFNSVGTKSAVWNCSSVEDIFEEKCFLDETKRQYKTSAKDDTEDKWSLSQTSAEVVVPIISSALSEPSEQCCGVATAESGSVRAVNSYVIDRPFNCNALPLPIVDADEVPSRNATQALTSSSSDLTLLENLIDSRCPCDALISQPPKDNTTQQLSPLRTDDDGNEKSYVLDRVMSCQWDPPEAQSFEALPESCPNGSQSKMDVDGWCRFTSGDSSSSENISRRLGNPYAFHAINDALRISGDSVDGAVTTGDTSEDTDRDNLVKSTSSDLRLSKSVKAQTHGDHFLRVFDQLNGAFVDIDEQLKSFDNIDQSNPKTNEQLLGDLSSSVKVNEVLLLGLQSVAATLVGQLDCADDISEVERTVAAIAGKFDGVKRSLAERRSSVDNSIKSDQLLDSKLLVLSKWTSDAEKRLYEDGIPVRLEQADAEARVSMLDSLLEEFISHHATSRGLDSDLDSAERTGVERRFELFGEECQLWLNYQRHVIEFLTEVDANEQQIRLCIGIVSERLALTNCVVDGEVDLFTMGSCFDELQAKLEKVSLLRLKADKLVTALLATKDEHFSSKLWNRGNLEVRLLELSSELVTLADMIAQVARTALGNQLMEIANRLKQVCIGEKLAISADNRAISNQLAEFEVKHHQNVEQLDAIDDSIRTIAHISDNLLMIDGSKLRLEILQHKSIEIRRQNHDRLNFIAAVEPLVIHFNALSSGLIASLSSLRSRLGYIDAAPGGNDIGVRAAVREAQMLLSEIREENLTRRELMAIECFLARQMTPEGVENMRSLTREIRTNYEALVHDARSKRMRLIEAFRTTIVDVNGNATSDFCFDLLLSLQTEVQQAECPASSVDVINEQTIENQQLLDDLSHLKSILDHLYQPSASENSSNSGEKLVTLPAGSPNEIPLEDLLAMYESVNDAVKQRCHLTAKMSAEAVKFEQAANAAREILVTAQKSLSTIDNLKPCSENDQRAQVQTVVETMRHCRRKLDDCGSAANFLLSKGSVVDTTRIRKEVGELESFFERVTAEVLKTETQMKNHSVKRSNCSRLFESLSNWMFDAVTSSSCSDSPCTGGDDVINAVPLVSLVSEISGDKVAEEASCRFRSTLSDEHVLDAVFSDARALEMRVRKLEVKRLMSEIEEVTCWFSAFDERLDEQLQVGSSIQSVDDTQNDLQKDSELLKLKVNRSQAVGLKVNELNAHCSEEVSTKVGEKLKCLQDLVPNVVERFSVHKVRTTEHCNHVLQFHATIETHEQWIAQVEEVVCMCRNTPSKMFDKIAQQVADCKAVRDTVNDHQKVLNDIAYSGTYIKLSALSADVIRVWKRLHQVHLNWRRLVGKMNEMTHLLYLAYRESRRFDASYKSVLKWLEDRIRFLNQSVVLKAGNIDICAKHLLVLQQGILEKVPLYQYVLTLGCSLKDGWQSNEAEANLLVEMLDSLETQWNDFWSDVCRRETDVQKALITPRRLKYAIKNIHGSLFRMQSSLYQETSLHGDLRTVQLLATQHQIVKNQVEEKLLIVKALHDCAEPDVQQIESVRQLMASLISLSDMRTKGLHQSQILAKEFERLRTSLSRWILSAEEKLSKFSGLILDEDKFGDRVILQTVLVKQTAERETQLSGFTTVGKVILGSCHLSAVDIVRQQSSMLFTKWHKLSTQLALGKEMIDGTCGECLSELEEMNFSAEQTLLKLETQFKGIDTNDEQDVVHHLKIHKIFHKQLSTMNSSILELINAARVSSSTQTNKKIAQLLYERANKLSSAWKQIIQLSLNFKKQLTKEARTIRRSSVDFVDWKHRCSTWIHDNLLRCTDIFRKHVKNNSITMTKADFIEALLTNKFPTTKLELVKVFEIIDEDDIDEITYQQFHDALSTERSQLSKPPHPRSSADRIEQVVAQQLALCQCSPALSYERVSNGVYKFGDKSLKYPVKVVPNSSEVVIRIGGGFEPLCTFLEKFDPCRGKACIESASVVTESRVNKSSRIAKETFRSASCDTSSCSFHQFPAHPNGSFLKITTQDCVEQSRSRNSGARSNESVSPRTRKTAPPSRQVGPNPPSPRCQLK